MRFKIKQWVKRMKFLSQGAFMISVRGRLAGSRRAGAGGRNAASLLFLGRPLRSLAHTQTPFWPISWRSGEAVINRDPSPEEAGRSA